MFLCQLNKIVLILIIQRNYSHFLFLYVFLLKEENSILYLQTGRRVGLFDGYQYSSHVPPTGRVWHKAFLGGSGTNPEPRHTQRLQKCLRLRGHSSKKKWGLELGGRPSEARGCWTRRTSTDCHRNQDTPDQIRVPTNTTDRSVSR